MIDPKTLTAESLYRLQSETWAQGAEAERQRILQAIENWRVALVNGEPYTNEELAAQRDNEYKNNFDYLVSIVKGDHK